MSAGMPTLVSPLRWSAHRVVGLGVDEHGHAELGRLERAGHLVGGGEREHAGELVLRDEVERLLDRARAPRVERDEVEHVAALACGGARALGDAARADVRELVGERADAVRASRLQAARGEVRPVVELVERAHDLLAGLGPDAREALQEPADRLVRHAGGLGDVVDRGASSAARPAPAGCPGSGRAPLRPVPARRFAARADLLARPCRPSDRRCAHVRAVISSRCRIGT